MRQTTLTPDVLKQVRAPIQINVIGSHTWAGSAGYDPTTFSKSRNHGHAWDEENSNLYKGYDR